MPLGRTLAAIVMALACSCATAVSASAAPPQIKHVFIVVLENENYDSTFGPDTQIPYLARKLTAKGQHLTHYYAIGHESLDNYIAMISGQSPNPQTQADCELFTNFTLNNPLVPIFPGNSGQQAWGQGCVYPAFVRTIADQLQTEGKTWKGYMEDMGNDPERDNGRRCAHPDPGPTSQDHTQSADANDQYATRHNPFVYFHSIIDEPSLCNERDVPLTRLSRDLKDPSNTSNYNFIVPNLCHDGHDEPCVNGEPGGMVSANRWLRKWIPKILKSPAFKRDGLLIVTFDEAEGLPGEGDASACCNEPTGPNTPNNGGPVQGNGGGRVGAVLLSPFIKPGTVNDTPYNHYSLLRSIEAIFDLPFLGYANSPNPGEFGSDVYGLNRRSRHRHGADQPATIGEPPAEGVLPEPIGGLAPQ